MVLIERVLEKAMFLTRAFFLRKKGVGILYTHPPIKPLFCSHCSLGSFLPKAELNVKIEDRKRAFKTSFHAEQSPGIARTNVPGM